VFQGASKELYTSLRLDHGELQNSAEIKTQASVEDLLDRVRLWKLVGSRRHKRHLRRYARRWSGEMLRGYIPLKESSVRRGFIGHLIRTMGGPRSGMSIETDYDLGAAGIATCRTYGVGRNNDKREWQAVFRQMMGHDLVRPGRIAAPTQVARA